MFKKLVVVSALSLGLVACSDSDSASPCESANKVFNQFEVQGCEEKFNSLENGDYTNLILAEVEACYNTAKQIQGFAGLKCNAAKEGDIEEVASAEEIAAALVLVESGLESLRASQGSTLSSIPTSPPAARSNSNERKPVVNCETVKAAIAPEDLARITFNSSCSFGEVDPVTNYKIKISDGLLTFPPICKLQNFKGNVVARFNVYLSADTDNIQEHFNQKYSHLGVAFSFHPSSRKGVRLSSTSRVGDHKVVQRIVIPGIALEDGYTFAGRSLSASVDVTDAGYCEITNNGELRFDRDEVKNNLKSHLKVEMKTF